MCGIAGYVRSGFPMAGLERLKRMGEVILHRGPDAGGEYLDDHVALCHRRLSIVDLSPLGNQPMASADGRFMIVFNGEIYNFLKLREELARSGVVFRSRTDTEVILALYQKEGAHCLERLNGMFAFAIWDKLERVLFLARDRIGKKPLYYHHAPQQRFAFASEIKSLLELPELDRSLEPTAVVDYLKYLYIPAPKTIYRNIFKLPAGHCLELRPGGEIRVSEYWDVDFTGGSTLSAQQAEERLVDLLEQSTACRMISDVPLGAFLSGGVDSSAVVALMSRVSGEPVKTCSIGFADRRHDETPYAREVSRLFGTEHKEYRVQDDLTGTVSLLPRFFDEPFADSSAVPTYHVSRLARQGVTVALAGDGGDESFGGYGKYTVELKEDLVRRSVPRPLLSLMQAGSRLGSGVLFRKVNSLAGSALADGGRGFYRTNTFITDEQLRLVLSDRIKSQCTGYDPADHTLRYWERTKGADHVTRMLYTDLKTYLPGDILVKVDRMSMANSLEVRAPFLDYRIIEFAATLPSSWKLAGREKKIILRKSFARLLPEQVLNRPKQGFTVPLDSWFRKELREMAQTSLHRPELGDLLEPAGVGQLWSEHQEGKQNHGTLLWSLLMLALWQREYLGGGHA